MRHKSFKANLCPVARSLDTIGEWWSLLIVRDALFGVRRFSDFQKSLGLAKNVLSARLKKLVASGVMEQVPASDGSAYREYALTEKGRDLLPVLVALRQWGESYLFWLPLRIERTLRRPTSSSRPKGTDRRASRGFPSQSRCSCGRRWQSI